MNILLWLKMMGVGYQIYMQLYAYSLSYTCIQEENLILDSQIQNSGKICSGIKIKWIGVSREEVELCWTVSTNIQVHLNCMKNKNNFRCSSTLISACLSEWNIIRTKYLLVIRGFILNYFYKYIIIHFTCFCFTLTERS